jgi:hypothetical protein
MVAQEMLDDRLAHIPAGASSWIRQGEKGCLTAFPAPFRSGQPASTVLSSGMSQFQPYLGRLTFSNTV